MIAATCVLRADFDRRDCGDRSPAPEPSFGPIVVEPDLRLVEKERQPTPPQEPDELQRDIDTFVAFYDFQRARQAYRVASRRPRKALYDLIAEQRLLPPISAPADEVPPASWPDLIPIVSTAKEPMTASLRGDEVHLLSHAPFNQRLTSS